MVLAIVDDLLFSSKIRAAAGATAAAVVFVRRRDGVLAAVRDQHPTAVILDLDRDALDPIGVIREIRSAPAFANIRLIGFASHVHAERLQEARAAGCDRVMARSGFVAALPELLAPAADSPRPPTIDDVVAAADRIAPYVRRTPLVRSPWLSDVVRGEVWLKLETAQATGSFKIRGAMNALALLRETRPDVNTVTTASAGNHGLALAKAGMAFGITVRVHLPVTAPRKKKDALRQFGAVMLEASTYDEAERRAREETARGGVTFISAYSHTDVIAGAGTVALEMIADQPDLDAFIVPLGGGGLISGTAIVARARLPGARVIGAEADASPVFTAALAAGRPVMVDVRPTVADGLAGNMEPDSQTFGLVRDLVDRVVQVREPTIVRAMRDLAAHDGLIAEGAAATAVGALLEGGLDLGGRRVGIVLSGENVDNTA